MEAPTSLPLVLDADEVAEVLRTTTRHVRTLAATGELPPISIGRKQRWAGQTVAGYVHRLLSEAVAS